MNAIYFDAMNIFKDNIENMFLQLSDVIILHLSRKYEFDAEEASKFIKDSFNIDNIKDDDEYCKVFDEIYTGIDNKFNGGL